MTTSRKAVLEDFEDIYPLLQNFNDTRIKKENYRDIFIDHWQQNENYAGYMLSDKGKAVGFIGLIFSEREIDGATEKFCNISSWIVDVEYRSVNHLLLLPLLKLKTHTLTNFSPTAEVHKILSKMGFRDFSTQRRVIYPIPALKTFSSKCRLVTDRDEISNELQSVNKKIFDDHSQFNCHHLLMKTKQGQCYILFNIISVRLKENSEKWSQVVQIHHISSADIFIEFIAKITVKLFLKYKAQALIVNENLINDAVIPFSVKIPNLMLYKSSKVSEKNIDTLYSELQILNI